MIVPLVKSMPGLRPPGNASEMTPGISSTADST